MGLFVDAGTIIVELLRSDASLFEGSLLSRIGVGSLLVARVVLALCFVVGSLPVSGVVLALCFVIGSLTVAGVVQALVGSLLVAGVVYTGTGWLTAS